jgi:hypothetical protein
MFGTEFRQVQQTQPAIAGRIEQTMRERLAADGSAWRREYPPASP